MKNRREKIPQICVGDYVIYRGRSMQVIGVVKYWDNNGREQRGYYCGEARGKRHYIRGSNSFSLVVRRAQQAKERSSGSEPGSVVSLANKDIR